MDIFDSNTNPFSILFKARNQAIDAVFYDVHSLTLEEWLSLTPWVDKKGKIIVVSPSASPKPIRHYESSFEFLQSDDWKSILAVAVAGVGSSVVGTAALARNVATPAMAMSPGSFPATAYPMSYKRALVAGSSSARSISSDMKWRMPSMT